MAELVPRSSRTQILKPLVQAALHNELRLLEAGMRRSHERLQEWEIRYGFSTPEFVRRFENNEFEETLEFAEWIGEHRLLERLKEKVQGSGMNYTAVASTVCAGSRQKVKRLT